MKKNQSGFIKKNRKKVKKHLIWRELKKIIVIKIELKRILRKKEGIWEKKNNNK